MKNLQEKLNLLKTKLNKATRENDKDTHWQIC